MIVIGQPPGEGELIIKLRDYLKRQELLLNLPEREAKAIGAFLDDYEAYQSERGRR